MTAPLTTEPLPKNPAVTLREIAPKRMVIHRFPSFSGEAKVAEKTAELTKWLSDNQFKPTGIAQLAHYNPPLTPPPFRRNEILLGGRAGGFCWMSLLDKGFRAILAGSDRRL